MKTAKQRKYICTVSMKLRNRQSGIMRLREKSLTRTTHNKKKGTQLTSELSACNCWCRDQDLNQGHTDFQSVALPTELSRQQ